jgi:hypothetical protein
MISTLLIFCAMDGAFGLIARVRASVPGDKDLGDSCSTGST